MYSCSEEGGGREGAISVSVSVWWPDWRLTTAAAAARHDQRLASLLSGDQGLDCGPGPGLPSAGQSPINCQVVSILGPPRFLKEFFNQSGIIIIFIGSRMEDFLMPGIDPERTAVLFLEFLLEYHSSLSIPI